jgi:hypothetical protein
MSSEIQEIIAHSTHKAFQQGVIRERERIISALEVFFAEDPDTDVKMDRKIWLTVKALLEGDDNGQDG